MKKVEINFPCSFESNEPHSIALGRLLVGDKVCRLFFGVDGLLHLCVPSSARSYIHFYDINSEDTKLTGFGL